MNTHDQDVGPVINLTGELVMLGPMEREQIPTYQRWLNNFETLRTQGEPLPRPDTIANVTRWYESYVTGRDDVSWFTIYEKDTAHPVGWTELKDVDHRHGTAEFAIMIGEAEARGKGYGTDTTRLMLRYGFKNLGLHNIHLYYMEFNPAAGHVYEKAGFTEYGRRTQAQVADGKRWDVVYMQCLATDFERQNG